MRYKTFRHLTKVQRAILVNAEIQNKAKKQKLEAETQGWEGTNTEQSCVKVSQEFAGLFQFGPWFCPCVTTASCFSFVWTSVPGFGAFNWEGWLSTVFSERGWTHSCVNETLRNVAPWAWKCTAGVGWTPLTQRLQPLPSLRPVGDDCGSNAGPKILCDGTLNRCLNQIVFHYIKNNTTARAFGGSPVASGCSRESYVLWICLR